MGRKRHTAEQIISKLRIAEVETSKGQTIGLVCRKLEISEQTYYKWRREYGGMRTDQAKRLKDLERQNAQLKKLVADQALDNSILKEAISRNYQVLTFSDDDGKSWSDAQLMILPRRGVRAMSWCI
jgi:putative transposase